MLLKYNFILTTQDFYKYSTIKKLADRIDSNIYNYQEQDIKIPDEFKHKPDEILSKISSVNKNEDCLNNVFLTGANGFVGIHVLYELLNTTNNAIYCLVRGKSIEHSLERLKKAYMFYFNTDISKYVNNRIYIVSGDIDAPNFGIDISLFNNYLNNFSTVIHTAAIVKHYGSFEDFRKINIDGTKNVVEFAYAYKKRLIHIYSISVSGNYLVKQNNLYGVIDTKGKTIISPEYKQIGIDISKFTQNGIENQYVLLNKIIPVKNNQDLWGIFDIKGQLVKDFIFTGIGCSSSNLSKIANSYPAVVIPSYQVIIVEKDKHYNIITTSGEELIPTYVLETIYLKTNTETGENTFYMAYNNNEKVMSVEEWLASTGR